MSNHPSMIDGTLSFAVGKAPAIAATPNKPAVSTPATPPFPPISQVAAQLQESTASTFSADPREQREFEERLDAWRDNYRSALEADGLTAGGSDRDFVYRQMVWHSVELERAQRRGIELVQAARERAVNLWHDDRDVKVEELGAALSRKPGIVVARLQNSAEGTKWLIDRWERLKFDVGRTKAVTAQQFSKIYDLMGTPLDERNEYSETVDVEGRLKLINAMIDRLRNVTYPNVCRADEIERKRVLEGTSTVLSPEQRYNKRCEATALRLFNAFRKELLEPSKSAQDAAEAATPPAVSKAEDAASRDWPRSETYTPFQELAKSNEPQTPTTTKAPAQNEATGTLGKMGAAVTPTLAQRSA